MFILMVSLDTVAATWGTHPCGRGTDEMREGHHDTVMMGSDASPHGSGIADQRPHTGEAYNSSCYLPEKRGRGDRNHAGSDKSARESLIVLE